MFGVGRCLLAMAFLLFPAHAFAADDFKILVQRQQIKDTLVLGTISVNDQPVGSSYENEKLKIEAKTYTGVMRYWSKHNFVQGPFGVIGHIGDFLIEVAGASPRTDILLHGGNKPGQSKGCIMLGAIPRDPNTLLPTVPDDSALRKLRLLFYGTEVPTSTPNKRITIEIRDPR